MSNMELTNDIKFKLFAKHFGQKIRRTNHKDGKSFTVTLDAYTLGKLGDTGRSSVLILKPLIQISDEDAIEMAKKFGGLDGEIIINRPEDTANPDIYFVVQVFQNVPQYKSYCIPKEWGGHRSAVEYQFLQNKGYDLPHLLLGEKTLHQAGLAIYE